MASTSADQTTKKILLRTSDKQEFSVDEIIALESQTIKHLIEDDCANQVIPLANVEGSILSKVIEYCKKHLEAKTDEEKENAKKWDKEFVKSEQKFLFELILAANYLDIQSLLDLTTQAVADMIKDFSPEEVRETFNIPNDFSDGEEDKVRQENAWAFKK